MSGRAARRASTSAPIHGPSRSFRSLGVPQPYKTGLMVTLPRAVMAYVRALFVPRHKLALEAAALRQQLAVLKRKQPRPKLHRLDRLFWIALRQLWSGWAEAL